MMQFLSILSEGLSTYRRGKGGIACCFDRDPVLENPDHFLQPVSPHALLAQLLFQLFHLVIQLIGSAGDRIESSAAFGGLVSALAGNLTDDAACGLTKRTNC